MSRLGGGIGTRGPGEKKLEVDRRLINDRIAQLMFVPVYAVSFTECDDLDKTERGEGGFGSTGKA